LDETLIRSDVNLPPYDNQLSVVSDFDPETAVIKTRLFVYCTVIAHAIQILIIYNTQRKIQRALDPVRYIVHTGPDMLLPRVWFPYHGLADKFCA